MYTTKITRTLSPAGVAPIGKLSHTYGLLPLLALLAATSAWSQTAPGADTPASAHYKFVTIGPRDSLSVVAHGINDAGIVTGSYEDSSSNYHGFVWQDGVFKTVDYPAAVDTFVYGVNNLGVAIGAYGNSLTGPIFTAVTYSIQDGTWTEFPSVPTQSLNFGYGINDGGVAVGDAIGFGWIWDPITFSYAFLNVPGAQPYSAFPFGINGKRQVVGYFADASYAQHGFTEEGGAYTTVDVPGAANTLLLGINSRGAIVGTWGNAAGTYQGFLMTSAGTLVNVNYPGAEQTGIGGINDRGDLCGYYAASSNGPDQAFIAILQ
jgi:probable HAF family extracellular repeat protein